MAKVVPVAHLVFRSSGLDMTLSQAIVLGAVQGMTEFSPISGSAQQILVPLILGWCDQGLAFDLVLHAGTLIAIHSFFWKDWMQVVSGAFQADRNLQRSRLLMLFLIICGTVPAAVAGFLARKRSRPCGAVPSFCR